MLTDNRKVNINEEASANDNEDSLIKDKFIMQLINITMLFSSMYLIRNEYRK